MPTGPRISVIIPTTASRSRIESLSRAVSSVLEQEGVQAEVLLVANGPSAEPSVLEAMELLPGVTVLCLASANLPAALAHGREAVDAEFFSQLDDDDELLPGALRLRLNALLSDPGMDFVVTRGLRGSADSEVESARSLDDAQADPLMAILRDNWLYPGSALYRTETVGPEYYRNVPPHLEWTFIGVKLALDRRPAFLNDVTFRYRTDNPDSISKTAAHVLDQPAALKALLALELPNLARRRVEQNLCAAYHACSVLKLRESQYGEAWIAHLNSLRFRYGLRYIPYTRRLFGAGGRGQEGSGNGSTNKGSVSGD